jgi:hypothetical protein
MFLTLSSLVAPQALFIGEPRPFESESACVRELPKMEGAVDRLIHYDVSALELFGTMIGGPIRSGYFVSASECMAAGTSP